VLQVAAVKALQARGMPLADIQARLYGRSDRELDAIVEAARIEVRRRPTSMKSVHWREISIEPGLRIQAEAGWAPADPGALEQRIRAAIAALTGERMSDVSEVPRIDDSGSRRSVLGTLAVTMAGARRSLPLSSVRFHARAADRVATVRMEQTFENPYTETLEAVYIFPLTGACAVSNFELRVAGRV